MIYGSLEKSKENSEKGSKTRTRKSRIWNKKIGISLDSDMYVYLSLHFYKLICSEKGFSSNPGIIYGGCASSIVNFYLVKKPNYELQHETILASFMVLAKSYF